MVVELVELYLQVCEVFIEVFDGVGVDLWVLFQGGLEEMFNCIEYIQLVLLVVSIGVWCVWNVVGGLCLLVLFGYSLGEYIVLVVVGVLSLYDGVYLVCLCGQLMQEVVLVGVGVMVVVFGVEDQLVLDVCVEVVGSQVVVLVNFNLLGQIVIGGDVDVVDCVLVLLVEKGVCKVVKLVVSVFLYILLMCEVVNCLVEVMVGLFWQVLQLLVVQNVDVQVYDGVDVICIVLVQQLYQLVQWIGCVQVLVVRGIIQIVECGLGKVLIGLVKCIDKVIDGCLLVMLGDFEVVCEVWLV